MSAPTFDDIREAYIDYADWESYRNTDQDTAITRARLFVTAAVRYLGVLPSQSATRDRTSASFQPSEIRMQMEVARRYLAVMGGDFATDPVRHTNFENFRD